MSKHAPQKRGKTTGKKMPHGKRFGEGQPNNKGGRPKGLMQYVRAQTKDGKELADFALKALRGDPLFIQPPKGSKLKPEPKWPSVSERFEALKWLGDRGFGKPIQELETSGPTITGIVVLPAEDPNA